MNLRKMYDSIENPLNSSTLRKLVDVYSKSSTSERGFYAKLMRDADKKDDDFDVNKNDMDVFCSTNRTRLCFNHQNLFAI